MNHRPCRNRRQFLALAGGTLAAPLVAAIARAARPDAPTAPVAISRCQSYNPAVLLRRLQVMADQIGGLSRLVSGKTVAVKVNLTGDASKAMLGRPAGRSYQVHPNMVVATAALLDAAGARRIRFLETTYQLGPIEKYLEEKAGWDMQALASLRAPVEFEDTRNLGKGKTYAEVKVPWGGSLYSGYHLNHSYVDCDVYVSLAKLKNHAMAGVTLGIKNNFGITPIALYSHHQPNENSTDARMALFHTGDERPADGLPQEVDTKGPRRPSYRVPRHTVDALGIRPIHLTILDGIETNSGGEGPWNSDIALQEPGLLLMGTNPVCTDSIATAVMGYDPTAADGTGPFAGTNHLALAASLGIGINDPRRIEVVGLPVKEALHPYKWEPKQRNV